ncbi:hypothetical protein RUND412_007732 [Rhizina undulata]
MSPVSTREFLQCLFRLWPTQPLPLRLGLAVSGGVDSMTLSHLIHKLVTVANIADKVSLHAFIVDHLSRSTSTDEARSVAELLASWGFVTHILPLSWGPEGPHGAAFETRARRLRYQALARACVSNDVRHLLLAHHGDDQAETVMMRLVTGAKFDGLAGIKEVAPVPESWGIYGADKICVGRPLLGIEKKRLIETCKESQIPWHEDHTNQDPTHTRRNTIRSLLTAAPCPLPTALQTSALIALAARAQLRLREIKASVRELLRYCNVTLCRKTGSLSFTLPQEVPWSHIEDRILMRLLVHIAELVSPLEQVDSNSMFQAFSGVFNATSSVKPFTAGGLLWSYEAGTWNLRRQPHSRETRQSSLLVFPRGDGEWSPWRLFDGRWWIRIRNLHPESEIIVRALQETDMKELRAKMGVGKGRRGTPWDEAMKTLPGQSRFTVPLVVVRRGGEEFILGLPTFNVYVRERLARKNIPWEWKFRVEEDEAGSVKVV